MNATTTVPDDIATLHALVVTEPFKTQSRMGYAAPDTPKGFVLKVQPLGQTNVFAGQGPRHPKAALIEVPEGTQPGDVLADHVVAAGIATAAAKQALVPAQRAARTAQRQAAAKAAADHQAVLAGLPARVAALEAKAGIAPKPAA